MEMFLLVHWISLLNSPRKLWISGLLLIGTKWEYREIRNMCLHTYIWVLRLKKCYKVKLGQGKTNITYPQAKIRSDNSTMKYETMTNEMMEKAWRVIHKIQKTLCYKLCVHYKYICKNCCDLYWRTAEIKKK